MTMCKPYHTCKKCGKDTVHMVTGWISELYGDQDDDCGNVSVYADEQVENVREITVGARVCYECGEVEDFWLEDWPGRDVKRLQARVEQLEAACQTALDTLGNLGCYHSSYCELCEQHAPKDYVTGQLIGVLHHSNDCPIQEIEEAISPATVGRGA